MLSTPWATKGVFLIRMQGLLDEHTEAEIAEMIRIFFRGVAVGQWPLKSEELWKDFWYQRAKCAKIMRDSGAVPAPTVPPRSPTGPFEEGIVAYDLGRFERALALWSPLAEAGNAAAQFNVGTLYEKGQGVARDDAAAAAWFLKAAERGDMQAQVKVAAWYESGTGMARDLTRARFWYGAALNQRDADVDALSMQRHARERLDALTREAVAQAEKVVAYEGGRFVLGRYAPGVCVVTLQGGVTASASYAFDGVIKSAAAEGCSSPTILLESLGGSLLDGLSLGLRIRQAGLQTIARAECASACGLIFLGGVQRVLWGPRARIGFHQVAIEGRQDHSRRCDQSNFSIEMRKVRAYLRQTTGENADPIFELIMKTSCEAIEWVAGQRAIELGVATRLDAQGVTPFAAGAPSPR